MVFRAYMHTGRFADVARQTTSVAHLGSTRFSKMPFPLPPLEEQQQIVREADRLLTVANQAALSVKQETTRAARLRQSILKQAFSGTLVPHRNGQQVDVPADHASGDGLPEGAQAKLDL